MIVLIRSKEFRVEAVWRERDVGCISEVRELHTEIHQVFVSFHVEARFLQVEAKIVPRVNLVLVHKN